MESQTDTETPAPEPPGSHWLLYLFFRPRQFFRHFVVTPVPILTTIAAICFGIAEAAHRLDDRLDRVGADTWPTYWGMATAAGLLGAAFTVVIGGWWYRFRLERCGAVRPDRRLILRVYLFANLVWALPALSYKVWHTTKYDSPMEAAASVDFAEIITLLVTLFWSVWTSYTGATTAFSLNINLARRWFLGYPLAFYLFILSAAFYAGFTSSAPDVSHPIRYQRNQFSFDYPGNWHIDSGAADHDPDVYFVIGSDSADCFATLHIEEHFDDNEQGVAAYQEQLSQTFKMMGWEPWNRWGSWDGFGQRTLGLIGQDGFEIRVFATRFGDTTLVVQEVCDLESLSATEPGFRLIRDTFLWH